MFGKRVVLCACVFAGLIMSGCTTDLGGISDMMVMNSALNTIKEAHAQKQVSLQTVGILRKPSFSAGDIYKIDGGSYFKFTSGESGDYYDLGTKKGTFSLGDDCKLSVKDLSGNSISSMEYWFSENNSSKYAFSKPMTKLISTEDGIFGLWIGSGMEIDLKYDGTVLYEYKTGTYSNFEGFIVPSCTEVDFYMFYTGNRLFGTCSRLYPAQSLPSGA